MEKGMKIKLGNSKIRKEEIIEFERKLDKKKLNMDEEEGKERVMGGIDEQGWKKEYIIMRMV